MTLKTFLHMPHSSHLPMQVAPLLGHNFYWPEIYTQGSVFSCTPSLWIAVVFKNILFCLPLALAVNSLLYMDSFHCMWTAEKENNLFCSQGDKEDMSENMVTNTTTLISGFVQWGKRFVAMIISCLWHYSQRIQTYTIKYQRPLLEGVCLNSLCWKSFLALSIWWPLITTEGEGWIKACHCRPTGSYKTVTSSNFLWNKSCT